METDKTTGQAGSNLRNDFLASIVVFLVALPLCMGIAIASGVPVAAGLITGIIGGIVVGCLAGCPLQVSGPAAGLTVIVYEIVQEFGFEMLGIVVLIGGLLQLVAGIFRLGQWFRAVSPAVIKGMLAGIGVLIFASQFHVMVDDKPKGNGLTNLLTIPAAIQKGIGIPEFSPTERRQTKTVMLREVGELHRRQESIAEKVAEHLPDHLSPEQFASQTEAQIQLEADALKVYVPEQTRLLTELEALVSKIEAFEREAPESSRSDKIMLQAPETLRAVRDASANLGEGDVHGAMKDQKAAVSAILELSDSLKNHHLAAMIGFLTIISIIVWQGFAPKSMKMVPAALVAVVLATTVAALLSVPVLYVEVPDNLWGEIRLPTMAILQDAPWAGLLQAAVLIAVVASAETLLCATAVDQMQQGPRTKYDRELAAQGVGNMLCGLVGALPMTGVIVRSTANVQAGGKTRLSAILHGVWLLVFVAGLAFLLRLIPTSALAAILVYTGYKLINPKSIRELYKYGLGEVFVFFVTVIVIVVTDLLTGVVVGVALAAARLLYQFSHLVADLQIDTKQNRAQLNLAGSATFLRLPLLASELESVPPGAELHVDLEHLDFIDHACLELLMNWAKQHESIGGKLVIDWASLHARFRADKLGTQTDTGGK